MDDSPQPGATLSAAVAIRQLDRLCKVSIVVSGGPPSDQSRAQMLEINSNIT